MTPILYTLVASFAVTMSGYSPFTGTRLVQRQQQNARSKNGVASLTMRKQKASNKRTRRMQAGKLTDAVLERNLESILRVGLTNSPMASASWSQKSIVGTPTGRSAVSGGRSRARKRSMVYNALSSYHANFLKLLTAEYRSEEAIVTRRIEASLEDPLGLEDSGHALYDMYPERRGNLFADEVYRLVKAKDATTVYDTTDTSLLPPNSKFAANDVILMTLQRGSSGDFFTTSTLPTSRDATSVEARVLSTGPSYVDVALPGGAFEAAFGPAPNNANPSSRGDPRMRLRADRFFSSVPYVRMVAALSQITTIPEKSQQQPKEVKEAGAKKPAGNNRINMDELFREVIIKSYGLAGPSDIMHCDADAFDLQEMSRKLAKPPLPSSPQLATEVLGYIHANPNNLFNKFNGPQMTAIGAALTRRLTLIQGPPGTGKTTTAGAIAFGFVHQCRSISPHAKVLACAFSNVGADNLAEHFLRLGLKVVHIGKPSAVSESLWDYTLDAAIANDPDAKKALEDAASATARLNNFSARQKRANRNNGGSAASDRVKRSHATNAVKASMRASKIAATKAMREADVIVSTSTGAADSRLLAACGISADDSDDEFGSKKGHVDSKLNKALRGGDENQNKRENGPDGLPPLSLPFLIVDEACQSIEPATLIPITSTNSCRAVVMLGDPCQLPPTVCTDTSKDGSSSKLSVSLMERLASTLPKPVIVTGEADKSEKDTSFLFAKPTRQAVSAVRAMSDITLQQSSTTKRFSGSLLLSVQYRMHPSIAAFSSAVFYNARLSTPSTLAFSRMFPNVLNERFPAETRTLSVRFVHIGGQKNEKRGTSSVTSSSSSHEFDSQRSYWNDAEATEIVSILKSLLKDGDAAAPQSVGVVTPYSAQVRHIKKLLDEDEEYQNMPKALRTIVEVKTIDSYQGRERDVVIFSAVRSNRKGNIGFLADWRRMNVALTRAKSGLIVIGDADTLQNGDVHWSALVKWCSSVSALTVVT